MVYSQNSVAYKHRILIKEGVSRCGTKTKRIENREVLIPDKLYQPYPLQQKSEEGDARKLV